MQEAQYCLQMFLLSLSEHGMLYLLLIQPTAWHQVAVGASIARVAACDVTKKNQVKKSFNSMIDFRRSPWIFAGPSLNFQKLN
jgi:hypothetical protein